MKIVGSLAALDAARAGAGLAVVPEDEAVVPPPRGGVGRRGRGGRAQGGPRVRACARGCDAVSGSFEAERSEA
jgi:hypothetical protein